jgi:hypothetical protein
MRRVPGLVLVAAVAGAFAQRFTPTGWWLNSSRGVVIASVVLAVLAAVASCRARPGLPRPAVAAAIWTGANIGMAIVLFSIGPGTIFPIVLAVGAGVSACAVGAGSLAGVLLRVLTAHKAG